MHTILRFLSAYEFGLYNKSVDSRMSLVKIQIENVVFIENLLRSILYFETRFLLSHFFLQHD